jgi:hypothetical protein
LLLPKKKDLTLDVKNKEWSYKTRYIILIGGVIGWIIAIIEAIKLFWM